MNRKQIQSWWKAALRIGSQFDDSPKAQCQSNNSNRVRGSTTKLQSHLRKLDLAQSRNWKSAADVVTHDCQQRITQTIRLLREIQHAVAETTVIRGVSTKEVFRDLMAIDQEFDEFHFDAKEPKLSVVTPRISLEGLDLGRFRIELQCESLASTSTAYYEIIALDPNPAETNEGVIHPHVEANRLCEGEAQPTIRLALRQGRVFDFFQIVQQVLGTYNPSSAYTKIADWSGTVCNHCGYTPDSDDTRDCHRCQASICVECVYACCNCDHCCCSDCHETCADCQDPVCESCRVVCGECEQSFCPQCTENERCETCEEKPKEDSDAGTEQTEVLADSVGEAVVPA